MEAIKGQVMKLIQQLPDSVTVDDILAELYFKAQVDAGLKELDVGEGIPHQKVKERMSKWVSK